MDNFSVGDIVIMKKGHPCGENRWSIVRTGADVKIKCLGCGRMIMFPRHEFIKKLKKVENKAEKN